MGQRVGVDRAAPTAPPALCLAAAGSPCPSESTCCARWSSSCCKVPLNARPGFTGSSHRCLRIWERMACSISDALACRPPGGLRASLLPTRCLLRVRSRSDGHLPHVGESITSPGYRHHQQHQSSGASYWSIELLQSRRPTQTLAEAVQRSLGSATDKQPKCPPDQ